MNLLRPSILSRAEALGMKARSIVEGLRVGDHKSPFRGFSVEFVQHREYVPGDDPRHIDWKSYGRSERYTIKQYEQETNFISHILFDGSLSMNYGEGDENKLEYARLLAASLSYMIVRQRDMVSLNIFDSKWRQRLPASSQNGHINKIATMLYDLKPTDKTGMAPLISLFAEQVRRRGIIFIISDVFDEIPPLMQSLQHLKFQGHDVTIFHILHHDEIEFPFDGNVRFDGLEELEQLKTRPHLIRKNYLNVFGQYLEELKRGCDANRVDYMQMNTRQPLQKTLAEYLVRRL